MMLAMHMANELLSVPVAAATLLLAAVAVGVAARRAITAEGGCATRLPLMGVMGAFVFAAQMINFPLPGLPGTSGHLGGAVLLAILLGADAAIVTMAGILIVQCLLFADGGLLALGTNIINMGVVPALLGGWVYRLLAGRGAGPADVLHGAPSPRSAGRRYLAAWAASTLAVTAGAALVPLEAGVSGVLRINPLHFLVMMLGVHLVIGLIEGAITFAVLAYLEKIGAGAKIGHGASHEVALATGAPDRLGRRAVLASVLATALLLGGVVSWFASAKPDGLEATLSHLSTPGQPAAQNDSPAVSAIDHQQAQLAPMPDYACRGDDPPAPRVNGWRSLAGVGGTLATLGMTPVAMGLLYALSRLRKKRDVKAPMAQ